MSRPHSRSVVLVDTSILLNVLRVPNRSDKHAMVMDRLREHIDVDDHLLLPAATVLETGNHIAQNGDGAERRKCAVKFVEVVRQAAEESLPWTLVELPSKPGDFVEWLASFPDSAMRGVGFGDLTIVKAWDETRHRNPGARVAIWSLDEDLQGYDQPARF